MDGTPEKDYSKEYTDGSLWEKIKAYAKTIGRPVVEQALFMYSAMRDSDTPLWARGVMLGALGYFITPLDAIPDMVPLAGLSDDLGVLAAAIGMVLVHIKPEHRKAAAAKAGEWFD